MERENRYIVIKVSDANKYLNWAENDKLSAVLESINDGRAIDNKSSIKCVVVEHDWPEYEPTWKAIEARVDKS